MARVTVEDCVGRVSNRFELVLIASKRARKLISGAQESPLNWENDKPAVMALREIAAGYDFNDEGELLGQDDSQEEDIDTGFGQQYN